jgi:hypothetical protein
MEDPKIFVPDDPDIGYNLDIDIKRGRMVKLSSVSGSNDTEVFQQRSLLSALFQKGTIPGMEDFGADWGKFLAKDSTLMEVDTQVKHNMADVLGEASLMGAPIPIYLQKEDGSLSLTMDSPPEMDPLQ